jgi:hypothetical protein
MSSSDRLLLILHIGFAIFTLGPLTAVTSATPRYIRRGEPAIVRYLNRGTRLYGLLALGVFLFGLLLAHGKFSEFWLSASMTLFVVALVLLFIVERDQRKAVHKLEVAAAVDGDEGEKAEAEPEPARVEQGRIAAFSGVVALIWLVILVLMVWNR